MRKRRVAALAAVAVASVATLSLLLLAAPAPTDPTEPPVPTSDTAPSSGPYLSLEPSQQTATGGATERDDPSADPYSPPPDPALFTYESSVNAFAFDLYRAVSADEKEEGRNLFFSPISIHTAFSVLYEGSRGNTAQQLLDAFRFEPDRGARHEAASTAIASLNRGDGHSELSLASALWPAEWFVPYDPYLEAARGAYGATVDTVDFTDKEDAVPRINAWASDNTNKKIEEVISQGDVNDLTAMVITNAIYFKGTWITQFSEGDTREDEFTMEDGSAVLADFMEVTAEFDYAAHDGYQVLRMPYEGDRLSMLVVLPGEPDGLGRLAEGLSAAALDGWTAGMDRREVRVVLPKFEAKTSYDLKSILETLGVTDAFSKERADLTGIGESMKGRLYVDKASHDAYVAVDEKGTEAAAVTAVIVMTDEAPPRPLDFVAEHPFFFIIHDSETGTMLFMGRLADPTK